MRARLDRSSTKGSGAAVVGWVSALLGRWRVGGEHVDEGAGAGRDRVATVEQHVAGVGLRSVEGPDRGAVRLHGGTLEGGAREEAAGSGVGEDLGLEGAVGVRRLVQALGAGGERDVTAQ